MKKFYLILAAAAAMTFTAGAQQVLTGQIAVGDYEGSTSMVEGSYFDAAPTNFYLAHTGSQMIYTADDLADFNDDKMNIQITKLTYRFYNEGFEEIVRDVKVYLQEINATEFAVVDGKKQFFDFNVTSPALEEEIYYDLLATYGEDGEMVFDLSSNPFSINAGSGLLVTAVFDAQDDSNTTYGTLVQFYSSGLRSRAMTFTNNTVSFLDYKDTEDFPDATASLGCGTSIELPVTLIDYTYEEAQTTSISDISVNNQDDGAYYNVMGQKLDGNNLPAGIYIHNGKKYIAK